ncbi:urea transporter [Staphylococcus pseudoxylosus]|uniref:urea transporter n=1 Tax=Staphylococcus pseudoxylosus TaxID=2282419 RepID=UPI000D1E4345|nr:urea transporter [Staphylococcus pseudoxylosus]PTI58482.1 urea transporter [Staphylococcus xylosus]MDW8797734.1 urea transporter [Staphylococcus pseudoxylosus]MEB6036986.1 urea transporter [Staphylococcus pseudoxylosus]MEB6044132.1 urea transporter [Staphylococcus pseudoxylosus]MEB7753772.1 urea transporter [Staphylococcus pseudoxylosus]
MNAVRIILKNIAQVLLLNNAWTGLFILLGLFVGNWKVGMMALAASVIALLLAKRTNYSNEEINTGLAGFNPVLTAIALTLFLVPEWYSILIAFIAIVITMPIGSAFREFFKPFGVPMLTMPYVFVSWVILLMSFQFKFVNADVNILPDTVQEIQFSGHSIHFINAFLSGFSEIFLLKSIMAGLLILIGIFIASRKAGVLAIVANLIGFTAVLVLGANHDQINDGLFGYNVILTVLALGVAFRTRIQRYISIVLGILLTVVLHAGMTTLLTPFGLPVFTLPFIIATWIMLFAGNRMKVQQIE